LEVLFHFFAPAKVGNAGKKIKELSKYKNLAIKKNSNIENKVDK